MLNKAFPRPPTTRTVGMQHPNIPLHERFPDRLHYSRAALSAFGGVVKTRCMSRLQITKRYPRRRNQNSDTMCKAERSVFVVVSPVQGSSGGTVVTSSGSDNVSERVPGPKALRQMPRLAQTQILVLYATTRHATRPKQTPSTV